MLLAIDIGNTNTVLGGYEGRKAIFTERISTDTSKTSLEYAILFKTALDLHGVDVSMIDGAIIGSVVPPLTYIVRTALKKVCGVQAYVVGPGLKTGLNIRMDDPTSIGADLIAGAVGALAKFEPPLMVIDMGTATTMIVIDETRSYVGGMIMTGLRLSLDALVIGKNTADAMRSGLLYGNAAMIDGLIDRVEAETGTHIQVVATGGLAGTVIGACTHDITLVRTLVLDGLVEIYHKNTKSEADAKAAGALA